MNSVLHRSPSYANITAIRVKDVGAVTFLLVLSVVAQRRHFPSGVMMRGTSPDADMAASKLMLPPDDVQSGFAVPFNA